MNRVLLAFDDLAAAACAVSVGLHWAVLLQSVFERIRLPDAAFASILAAFVRGPRPKRVWFHSEPYTQWNMENGVTAFVVLDASTGASVRGHRRLIR